MQLNNFLNNIAYLYLIDEDFQKISDLSGIEWGLLPDFDCVTIVRKYLTLRGNNPHKVALSECSQDVSFLEHHDLDLQSIGKDEDEIGFQFRKSLKAYRFTELGKKLISSPENGEKLLQEFDATELKSISTKTVTEFLPVEYEKFLEKQKLGKERVIIPGFEMTSKMIGGFNPGRLLMLLGETGFGKCLGKGTKVLKYNGSLVNVEDLVVNDKLMGPDSKPRKILSLGRGKSQLYKITLNIGDSFVCNGEHILSLIKTGTNDMLEITVNEYLIKDNTFKHKWKAWKSGVNFKEKSLDLDPYFAGVWLGDGTIKKPEITTPEPEIKNYVLNYAKQLGLVVRVYKAKGCEQLNITKGFNSSEKTILQKMLVDFVKDNKKTIPISYLTGSRKQRLEILAGLVDTDGYTFKNTIEISTKYENLRDDILYLCRSLGFRVSHSIKTVNGTDYYLVFISGDTQEIPCKVPRKKPAARKQIKRSNVYGFKVEPIGVGDYYGFEIDKDGLFLLGDYTVTHNTNFALNVLIRASTKFKCLFINMEMSLADITNRLVVLTTQKGFKSLYAGEIKHEDAVFNLKAYGDNLKFTEGYSLGLQTIESLMRKEKQLGLDFVVIDYDQKIDLVYSKNIPEWKLIQIAIQKIEQIAIELNICVILLAQINRDGQISSSHRSTFAAHTILNFKSNDASTVYDNQANALISAEKNRYGKKDQACLLKYSQETLNINEVTVIDYKKAEAGARREKSL